MATRANLKLILITLIQLALMILYVYSPQYHEAFASLDNIAYGHISHQLYLGNWKAFFNLTWSGMSPLVASLFQHLGMDVLPSLSATRILFSTLALFILNHLALKTNQSNKYQYALIIIYTLLTFSIVQSVSDPALLLGLILFFYWLLYKKQTSTYSLTLIAIAIFTGLARPVGFYIVLAAITVKLFLTWKQSIPNKNSTNQTQHKLQPVLISFVAIVLLTAIWAFTLGEMNHIPPTLGKNGAYNLSSIGKLQGQMHYNSEDKWTAIASTYNDDLSYQSKRKISINPRLTHQWRWIDISSNVGVDLPPWPQSFDKATLLYLFKYYASNVYVFLKDFIWWIIILLTVALNKKPSTNWWVFILVFAFYLNLLFISHIETRYLVPLIIVALLILNQEDHQLTWFNKKQILILLLITQFQYIIQFSSYCAKSLLNQNPPKPYYLQQEIPQPTQYVSFETMRPAWLTVKNPNLIFLGTLKDSAQLRTISDKNIKLVTFHNDTAQFQPIIQ